MAMGLLEICSVYTACRTAAEVMAAFTQRPVFDKPGPDHEGVDILDGFVDALDGKANEMAALLREMVPHDHFDRDAWAHIILRNAIDNGEELSEIAALAASVAGGAE
ncbi:hypothetical protein [Prosthecomicrobium pneumaticum]|uniref:Uncharacterized protein n=1 Tax=Prosthecomicrobium pneumaticum TaxID=81895 RepID=A0A7W9FP88_9HYPH|nr:hypothetical protein [Prosthecomicrobium pneumaticum]MBB5754348.1 hypothetical protein [Prosthecomicrobium pneumaticum]